MSPESIKLHQEERKLKFSKLVEKFFEGKWISENECEDAKLQYDKFLSSSAKEHKEKFVKFDRTSDRVGLFLERFSMKIRPMDSCGRFVKSYSHCLMGRVQ